MRLEMPQWPRRIVLFLALALFVGLGCSTVYRAAYSPAHRSDFTVYTAAGKAVLDGTNIYEAYNVRGWYYMYLPVFAVVMVPFALMNTFSASLIWYLLSVVMVAQSLVVSVRLAHRFFPQSSLPNFWIGVLAFVLAAKPIISGITRGQASILVMYLGVMTVWFYFQNRHWLGGLCLAGSIVLKVFPALLLAYLIVKRRYAMALATAAWLFFLVLLLPSAAFGPRGNWTLVQQWMDTIAMPANLPANAGSKDVVYEQMINPYIDRNQSVQAVLIRWMALKTIHTAYITQEPLARKWAFNLNVCLALISMAACLKGWAQTGERLTLLQLCAILLLMLFLSPVSWIHNYALSILPAAVALAGWRNGAGSASRFYGIGLLLLAAGTVLSFIRLFNYCGAMLWGAIALWTAFAWIAIETPKPRGLCCGRPDGEIPVPGHNEKIVAGGGAPAMARPSDS